MLRLLNSKRKEPEDRLAEPRETRKWLSALPACDPLGTCAEITNTLREAKANFVEFTTERNSAVLLVDALSAPLQGALLEDYAAGAHCDHDRGQQIVATLSAMNHAFGAYYEALIDSLRTMAPNRDYRSQTYMMLTRRLAHLRYDVVLSAMRYEKWIPLRWEKTHRLYRLAMQQSLHEVGAPGKGIAERAVLENSAESEYIQILLTHQLNQGQLDPRDILRALGWLARWVDKLSVTKTPGSGSAFALYPDGRAGLIEPPRTVEAGVLWLDLAPLLAQIQKEIEEAQYRQVGEGNGSAQAQRIVLLNRLLVLWCAPIGETRRREARRAIRESVHVEFDLPIIALAVNHAETRAKDSECEEIELRAVGDDGRVDSDIWTVYDVSVSGCRLRGKVRPDVLIAPGSLVAMHLAATQVWMVGIVRRILRLMGGEVDLGVQILTTRLRLLDLRDGETAEHANECLDGAGDATASGHAPPSGRKPALLLAPGAGRLARTEQSVIVVAGDYAPGRVYTCATGRSSYRLTLQRPIERNGDYVWATISAAKLPAPAQ